MIQGTLVELEWADVLNDGTVNLGGGGGWDDRWIGQVER
jgi:hypothetical protein